MLRSLNSLLYRAYLKKSGLIIGLPDEYYTMTENINSLFFTFQVVKMIKEG